MPQQAGQHCAELSHRHAGGPGQGADHRQGQPTLEHLLLNALSFNDKGCAGDEAVVHPQRAPVGEVQAVLFGRQKKQRIVGAASAAGAQAQSQRQGQGKQSKSFHSLSFCLYANWAW